MFKVQRAILILLAVLCFGGAARMLPVVDKARTKMYSLTPYAGAPTQPDVALLTHLLGGFRGLLVDIVWFRASSLQQQQKYWELYQLYDWIGKLEPYLEDVWVHNGWNMSYNLVAELPDSEARWQWIRRAIEWLRDQGLKYNPQSAKILDRIAWIYWHKMGHGTDLHNMYYKHRWALMMHSVMGSREMQDVEGIYEASEKYKTLDALLREPDVGEMFAGYLLDPPENTIAQIDEVERLEDLPKEITELLEKNEDASATRKVRNYFAARVLRDVYKMDRLDIMANMQKEFGKLDWRLPEPHAIYWSFLARDAVTQMSGVSELLGDRDPTELLKESWERRVLKKRMVDKYFTDRLDHDRIILFCLKEVMRRGIIAYISLDDLNKPMVILPDMDKGESVHKFYQYLLETYTLDWDPYRYNSIRDGHEGFLRERAFELYFAGYFEEASKYHKLRYEIYDKPHPFVPIKEYALGQVKEFVDEWASPERMIAFVHNLVSQAYFRYCIGEGEKGRDLEVLAYNAWVAYLQYRERGEDQHGRVRHAGMWSWDEMCRWTVATILAGKNTIFPPALIPKFKELLGIEGEVKIDDMQFGGGITVPQVGSSPTDEEP